ncbi:ABC transporter ATP-binding protein [Algisphaera agarilytica]|uniref:ABC-2 type transport system ATP-binding protein n=1 Tax=Algisphaera agarilytica TaxID=1385975 RepID=A0A7X0LJ69_9BACT|nr:ABC transporter ATP-binding protein [Algisphaera agarilytica]MBB6428537.1 ABC-2 type transport system ATP-binding protein [Algisphaera agarilytica]
MIEVDAVSKAFAGRPAVQDLSLTVRRGEVYGLLGHNGAGKSTTLGMMLGQVFPDAGRVVLNGADVLRRRRAALSGVGAIFESPCFYDYLTGRRNLRIFAHYSKRVAESRLDEVVEQVGLAGRIDDPVGTYSHGMRQRLALGQALLHRPEMLILDEPTDGLDPQGIAEFRGTIRRLNQDQGMTILFSSHLLSEVEQVCDRVAVLHQGRRVFEGEWDAVNTGAAELDLEVDRRDEALVRLREAGLIHETHDPSRPNRVVLSKAADPAAVNRCLVESGFAVHRLDPVRPTLEAFYMRTVGVSSEGIGPQQDQRVAQEGGAPC